jgi:osmoprotectant transport system permease protein
MTQNLFEQLVLLPGNMANHMLISVIPLLIGISVSLPMAIFVVKNPKLRYPTLTLVSIVQTIPSLALLALMVPILVGIGSLTTRWFGFEVSALGFYPTVIALTMYSILPILRNTVTGILGVEPSLVEAARGCGMTEKQILRKVELPLAAPIIIAGIRTATVWVVGIATLATPVGQQCLGNFIFRGLQTRNWTAVLVGCVAAALLAMLLDLLIGGIQKAVSDRNRKLGILSLTALIIIFVLGLVSPSLVRWAQSSEKDDTRVVLIGSKTFTEQYILADLVKEVLTDAGFRPREKTSLGSTVIFDALVNGEIDCYIDYSGTIWANYMNKEHTASSGKVLEEMREWLQQNHSVTSLGSLGFENAYGLAMEKEDTEKLGIFSIGDLRGHAGSMVIGGDYEFFGRPEWRTIKETYEISFQVQESYDSTFMYKALVEDEVDVISAFTSDGRIEAFDLVVLDDPENAIPPYDAVLLLSGKAAQNRKLVRALKPLIGAIPIETMRYANYLVDREKNKKTIHHAAMWLKNQIPDLQEK